jgi:hypothetical protein
MMSNAYVKPEYPLSDVTGRIIGAATRVHRNLGPGFEEVIYQRALALELQAEDWSLAGKSGSISTIGVWLLGRSESIF